MAKFEPIKLAYSVFESKAGSDLNLTPVIFLHGMTSSKEMWGDIPQIIANKTKRKVYAYDARNHGDSEYTDDFNFTVLIDDLFYFMDQRNIQKAILVGHSMGGFTSTSAALKVPERIEMIFSEDMFINKLPDDFLSMAAQSFTLLKESIEKIPANINEEENPNFQWEYMFNHMPLDHPCIKMMRKDDLQRMITRIKCKADGSYELGFNADAIIRSLKDPENFAKDPDGLFNGPAYFLYGDKSPLKVKHHEENIKKHFPKAELIEFNGAYHFVHSEFPDKFVDTILYRLQN